jgi:uncharacterized protein
MDREFQIFVKPVGATCNLRCSYCYYLDKQDIYSSSAPACMPEDLLVKYIIQHIEASTGETVMFSWHGGEPLLAGLDFYRKAVKLQRKHLPPGKSLLNGIQTNGTLLSNEFCSFLADEGFIAGISIDGPEELHGRHRLTPAGTSSFARAINGLKLLRRYGVKSEILCVVGNHNAGHPSEVYGFFKKLGAEYITFLPLVMPTDISSEQVSPDSVRAKEFGDFLIKIFDEWKEKDIGRIRIQIFEEALRSAFDQDHTLCIFKVNCGGVPVVERNGDFYSCDHFVNNDHLVGNITKRSVAEMLDSPEQKAFGAAKSATLPQYCRSCEVINMCNGECPKNRFIKSPDGEPGLNYLCEGYKKFFNHCRPFTEAISDVWRNQKK